MRSDNLRLQLSGRSGAVCGGTSSAGFDSACRLHAALRGGSHFASLKLQNGATRRADHGRAGGRAGLHDDEHVGGVRPQPLHRLLARHLAMRACVSCIDNTAGRAGMRVPRWAARRARRRRPRCHTGAAAAVRSGATDAAPRATAERRQLHAARQLAQPRAAPQRRLRQRSSSRAARPRAPACRARSPRQRSPAATQATWMPPPATRCRAQSQSRAASAGESWAPVPTAGGPASARRRRAGSASTRAPR